MRTADKSLIEGPWSVTDKTSIPPSNCSRDYYNPSPYIWPNPNTKSRHPFITRDGVRVPGTELYGPESHRYDRTRLAAMQGKPLH